MSENFSDLAFTLLSTITASSHNLFYFRNRERGSCAAFHPCSVCPQLPPQVAAISVAMAGKMVLYKLMVLGDGGCGKTALVIQVFVTRDTLISMGAILTDS